MRPPIKLAALLTMATAASVQTTAFSQESATQAAAARQSAISAAQSELQSLKQQLAELEASGAICDEKQASQSIQINQNTRWLVVGTRLTWIPASQLGLTGVAGSATSLPQGFASQSLTSSSVNLNFNRSAGVFSAPTANSAAINGTFSEALSRPFSPAGFSILPASPNKMHLSYGIYSQGAFSHSMTKSLSGASAIPTYPTTHFRWTTGFVAPVAVPYYAAY